jgi:hypothetical protein
MKTFQPAFGKKARSSVSARRTFSGADGKKAVFRRRPGVISRRNAPFFGAEKRFSDSGEIKACSAEYRYWMLLSSDVFMMMLIRIAHPSFPKKCTWPESASGTVRHGPALINRPSRNERP